MKLLFCGLGFPNGTQRENQRKRKERQIFRPYQRTKKAVEQEANCDTNCNWSSWNCHQILKWVWESWTSEDKSKSYKLRNV